MRFAISIFRPRRERWLRIGGSLVRFKTDRSGSMRVTVASVSDGKPEWIDGLPIDASTAHVEEFLRSQSR